MEFYKPSDFTTPYLTEMSAEIEESIRQSVKHYNDILKGIIQYILPQVGLEYNEENFKRITKEYRVDCDIYYLDFNTENQITLFSEIRKTEYKLGKDCSCNTTYSYKSNFKLPNNNLQGFFKLNNSELSELEKQWLKFLDESNRDKIPFMDYLRTYRRKP